MPPWSLGRVIVRLGFFLLVYLLSHVAIAANKSADMPEQITFEMLSDARRITIPVPASAPTTFVVGILQGHVVLAPSPCPTPTCRDSMVKLAPASHLLGSAIVNLNEKTLVNLRALNTTKIELQNNGRPALLVLSQTRDDSGAQRDTLQLIDFKSKPKLIFETLTRSLSVDGSGYESYELSIEPSSHKNAWPNLSMVQNALPAAGQQPEMPGPPLLMHYQFRKDRYRQVD